MKQDPSKIINYNANVDMDLFTNYSLNDEMNLELHFTAFYLYISKFSNILNLTLHLFFTECLDVVKLHKKK